MFTRLAIPRFATIAAIALVGLLLIGTVQPAFAGERAPARPAPLTGRSAAVNAPAETLTTEQAEVLLYMREEEKLAHDLYVTLGEEWGLRIFTNIARAETRHTESVAALLARYGLDDPAEGRPVGSFANADLQALYDELVAAGSESVVAALQAGALVEETDIADLNESLNAAEALPADVATVFSHLRAGSDNHLRAFVRQLARNGAPYTPQVLDAQRFAEIVQRSPGRP
jgi:hypothetical protein